MTVIVFFFVDWIREIAKIDQSIFLEASRQSRILNSPNSPFNISRFFILLDYFIYCSIGFAIPFGVHKFVIPLDSSIISRAFGLSLERRSDHCSGVIDLSAYISESRMCALLSGLRFYVNVSMRIYEYVIYGAFSHAIHIENIFSAIFLYHMKDCGFLRSFWDSCCDYDLWSRSLITFLRIYVSINSQERVFLEIRSCVDLNLEQNRDCRFYPADSIDRFFIFFGRLPRFSTIYEAIAPFGSYDI